MSQEQDSNLLEIIARIKDGDTMAFETVLNQYKGLAFTVALRIVDSREDAEEVVQDAFFKVFRFIGQYKVIQNLHHGFIKLFIILR